MMCWYGSKWRIAPWVIANLPHHEEYVEPFGGALGVLLRKPRCHSETINDLDSEIVNLYRVLRDPEQASRLIDACRLTPFSREEFEEAYIPSECPVESARRFIFRSFAGMSSAALEKKGFRWKHRGKIYSAAQSWFNYPEGLREVVQRLSCVIIEHLPAIKLIGRYTSPDTLIYCDPPYLKSTRSSSSHAIVYRHEMSDADHVALSEALHESPCMVVVSGYPSPLYEDLYADWECRQLKSYTFDKTGGGNAPRTECLWLNPQAVPRVPQQSLRLDR